MPDGKDKKYVSDPALLAELGGGASSPAPSSSGKPYVTDPSLLEELGGPSTQAASITTDVIEQPESVTQPVSNTDFIPAVTESGREVSVRPGSQMARSLQQATKQKTQDVAGQGLKYANDILNKNYGIQAPEAGKEVTTRKKYMTSSGDIVKQATTYNTQGGVNQRTTVTDPATAEYQALQEKKKALSELKQETDSPAEAITGDLQQLVGSLPQSAKDALAANGMLDESFIERVVDRNGNTDALKQYVNYRLPLLSKQKEAELAAIHGNKPIGYTFTAEDERLYKQKADAIEEKYADQVEDLQNAAFGLAAQKVVGQKIRDFQGNLNMVDPYEVGMEVQKILGGEQMVERQMREIGQGIVDPNDRYARGLMGYRALQYAGATAEANGDEMAANSIAELTKGYQRKLIDGNPEYRQQQVKEAIANELYKDKQGLGSLITGYTPTKKDVDRVGTELGIPAKDMEGINPEDIKRQSNVFSAFGQALASNAAAPIAEGLGRHVLNPIANIFGKGYSQEELDAKYDNDWYYNSDFGRFMGGKQPTAGTLLEGGSKIETNPQSDKYLMSVSDEDNSKWNWNIGSVGNTVIDGAAQILSNSAGAKAIGGGLMAANAVKSADVANRIGSMAYIYANGYDRNYKNTPQDIPEANRVALANVYSIVEGLSEQILPDFKITDKVFSGTRAGRELIDRIAKDGLEGLDKGYMTDAVKKMAIEWGQQTGQEGLEEFVTPFGEAVGDVFFAPKQFEDRSYLKEAWEQGVVGAISAALPTGAGAISNIRSRGPMGQSALLEVGKNSNEYIDQINQDVSKGKFSQEDANDKIQVVNTLSDIVSKSVPERSLVNGQYLTDKQQAQYTSLSLQERLLDQKKKEVNDAVQERHIDRQIADIQQQKENVLANAGQSTEQETGSVPEPSPTVETQVLPLAGEASADNMGFEEEEDGVSAEVPAGEPVVTEATADTEQEIPQEDIITFNELIDKPVIYNGQKGTLYQDGQTIVVKINGTNKEYELGNVEELNQATIGEFGVEPEVSVVSVNDNNDIVVRGVAYKNNYSDPLAAINRDENGDVMSVTLDTDNGQKRTFRGDVADDIAYNLTLQNLIQNNDQAEFEQFLNTDESAREQVDNARLSEAIEEGPVAADEPVQRQKAKREPRKGPKQPVKQFDYDKAERQHAKNVLTKAFTGEGSGDIINPQTQISNEGSDVNTELNPAANISIVPNDKRSFNNKNGHVLSFDIEGKNGNDVGQVTVVNTPNGYRVGNTFLNEDYRGKGIGTELYKKLNALSMEATGRPLYSNATFEGETAPSRTKDADKLWDSLVRSGLADKEANGRYSFKGDGNVMQQRAPRPVVDYTTKTGKQRVFVENGVLKVVDPKTGKEVPATTRRRAIADAASNYDFVSGEYSPPIADSKGMTDEEIGLHIVNNSENPIELIQVYTMQQPEGVGLDSIENAILDFGGFTTTNASYNRFGDRNTMTLGKGKAYVNNAKGEGLDQIADEITSHTGVEVTPEDLVRFMDRFPQGMSDALRTFPNNVAQKAADKFEKLTGFPLTESISKIAQEQEYESYSQAEKDFINQDYESRQQLETEFNRAVEEGRFDISPEAGILQPTTQEENVAGAERAGTAETRAGPVSEQPVTDEVLSQEEVAPTPVQQEEQPLTAPEDLPLPPTAEPEPGTEKTLDQQLSDVVNEINEINDKLSRTKAAMESLRRQGKEQSDEHKVKSAVNTKLSNKLKDANQRHNDLMGRLDSEYKKQQRKLSKERQKQTKISATIKANDLRSKKKVDDGTDVRASIFGITDVKVYNAALEIAARAVEAGAHISIAAQQAVDFINSRIFTNWDEAKFRDKAIGENDLYPLNADELRKRKANEANLSKKNAEMADGLVNDIKDGKRSLNDVISEVQQTSLSQPLKDKITMYIRRSVNDHFKSTGNDLADQLIQDNGGDYDAALNQLAMDSEVELLNAQTDSERDAINRRFLMAQTAIQREQISEGIQNGTVDQAKMFPQGSSSQQAQGQFSLPDQTKLQRQEQKKVDRYTRLRQAQNLSQKPITEQNDAVAAYRLMRGRAWAKINEIKDYLGDTAKVKGSFFHKLKQSGGDIHGFSWYLYAKHAAERNAKNAEDRQRIWEDKVNDLKVKIGNAVSDEAKVKYHKEMDDIINQKNPDYLLMPDGGSGMTNAQAQEILQQVEQDGLTDKYEDLAKEFRENVIDKILDFKHDSGLITDEEYNKIKSAYENYVPLKVDMDEEGQILTGDNSKDTPASTGHSGRDLYRTTGASELTYDKRNLPVLQAISDLDYSIMKGAENIANQRLANLIRQNPNESIWEVKSAQYDVTKDKNGNVIYGEERNRPKDGIPVWENGKKSYIVLHDPALKDMFQRVEPTQALRILQGVTNLVRMMATLRNPDFILTNPIIDMQDAAAYVGGEKNKEVVKKYKENLGIKAGVVPTAYPKILKQLFSGKGEWADLYKEWAGEGAEVTFSSKVGLDEQAKKTLETFEEYDKKLSPSDAKILYKNAGKALGKIANTLEIATRLAVYKSGKDAGLSKEESALLSRDATIDFEKSGTQGAYINAWKAFANAGIQGTVGTWKLLARSKRLRQIVGGMVAFGAAQAWLADMMSNCDEDPEDCYWEMPEYKKQRSVVIPVGDRMITVPIGRRLGWFNYLGQQMYSVAKGMKTGGEQGESVPGAVVNIVRSMLDYYNPTGGDAPIMQQAFGNFGPVAGLMMNENAFGQQISPTNKQEVPDHLNYFPHTNKGFVETANALSAISGGGGAEEGKIEISPNTLQHLLQSVTTGFGAFVGRVGTMGYKGATGEGIEAKDVPFLNRFYRASEMAQTKTKKGELVERSKNHTMSDEDIEKLEGYLDDLVEAGELKEEQKDATLKFVDNNQDKLEKRREKIAEAEESEDEE